MESALADSREVSDRKGKAQSLGALARLDAAEGHQSGRRADEAAAPDRNHAHRITHPRPSHLLLSGQSDFYDLAIDLAMARGLGPGRGWSGRERKRARRCWIGRKDEADTEDPFASIAGVDEIRRDLLDRRHYWWSIRPASGLRYAWVIRTRLAGAFGGRDGRRSLRCWTVKRRSNVRARDPCRPGQSAARDRTPDLVAAEYRENSAGIVIAPDAGLEYVLALLPASAGGKRPIEICEVVSVPSASLAAAIPAQSGEESRISRFSPIPASTADGCAERARQAAAKRMTEELSRGCVSRGEEAGEPSRRRAPTSATEWLDFGANLDNLRRAAEPTRERSPLGNACDCRERDPAIPGCALAIRREGQRRCPANCG